MDPPGRRTGGRLTSNGGASIRTPGYRSSRLHRLHRGDWHCGIRNRIPQRDCSGFSPDSMTTPWLVAPSLGCPFLKCQFQSNSAWNATGTEFPRDFLEFPQCFALNGLQTKGDSRLYKVGPSLHILRPMMLATIDWLSISINLLLVIFVIVCLLMTLLVLMQRPKQEGLGAAFGGGVTDQVFGARTTNVLQRGTVYLGSLFFLLSLTLAVLIGLKNKKVGTLDQPSAVVEETSKGTPKNEATTPLPASLAEQVPDANSQTPATTPAAQTTNDSSTSQQATKEPAAQESTPAKPANEGTKETPAENTGEGSSGQ